MKKKLLKSVPAPNADEEAIRNIAKEGKGTRGVIITQKNKVDDNETLILNVYQVSGRNKKDISLIFRVFCQKSDYITLDVESGKWRTGALLNLVCKDSGWSEYWWSYEQLEFLSDTDAKRAENTFRKWLKDKTDCGKRPVFSLLHRYQESIKASRLEIKHKKITDVIDMHMDKFGDIPDDYQQWTEKVLFADGNYMFYNRKTNKAYCTKCGWDFDIRNDGKRLENKIGIWYNSNEPIRHNRHIICPYCNSYLETKSENMSRGQLVHIKWSVLVQKHEEEVLVRYFCHVKDFSGKDYRNPKYTRSEQFRAVHSKEKSIDFEWNKFKQTGVRRWIYQRENYYCYWSPSEFVLPRTVTLYNTQLDKDLEGTCMKYSCAKEFLDWLAEKNMDPRYNTSPWIVDRYFNSYRKYPWIEQLIKCGFIALADEMLTNDKIDKSKIKMERTICETLGITKNMFNILKKQSEVKYRDIEIMKYYREKYGTDILERDFDKLRYVHDNGYSNMYKKFIDFMEYTTLHKLKSYMSKQRIIKENDYFDYAGWMLEMGYDMRNEFNLYPKDFVSSHDVMSKQYMRFKDKQAREDTKKFNRLLKKMKNDTADVEAMNLKVQGLFIRLPNRLDELKEEGEALHHCVGTYMEKVRQGKTMIFFIRKIEEPDKPFYTLEWRGSVVQCRGSHNCAMTPVVKAFVELFAEKMSEYENAPSKKRKAG